MTATAAVSVMWGMALDLLSLEAGELMARSLRYIPADALVEVTTRTMQSRYLLQPSPKVNSIIIGVLGRGQKLFGVRIHAFVFLSNHWHALLTVRDGAQLAAFMSFVNGNIAREVGRVHAWRQRFWGRRYSAIVVADEESQVERLRYIFRNGCKEGLVDRPGEWSGASCVQALTDRASLRGTWNDRTAVYQARRKGSPSGARRFAQQYQVKLSPLPCWRRRSRASRRKACARMVAAIEADRREERTRAGSAALGMSGVLAAHPHAQPRLITSSPAPRVHAACKHVRQAFIDAYNAFVDAFRTAAALLRAGKAGADFPEGSFPPRGPFIRFASPPN
jgi:putative transposase